MRRIIAFVGMAGSGKSIATDIAVTLGFTPVHFGDAVMDEIARQGLPVNERSERKIREDLRKRHGIAAFAVLAIPRIDRIPGDVVIDGLYSWQEYQALRERYPKIKVIAVCASPRTRYARLKVRPDRPLSTEEARARDVSEIENLDKG